MRSSWRRRALATAAAAVTASAGVLGVGVPGPGVLGAGFLGAGFLGPRMASADPATAPALATVLAANAKIRRALGGTVPNVPGRPPAGPSGDGHAAADPPPAGHPPAMDGDIVGGGFTAVAVGAGHTCALGVVLDVWCFGSNASGQLGMGTANKATRPVRVRALAKKSTISVAAGRAHTCTLSITLAGAGMREPSLYCWGANDEGQIGDGTRTTRNGPVKVLDQVSAVALGQDHTCALLPAGTVSCWGRNDVGQLGLGTVGGVHNAPRRVPGLTGVVALSADDNNTCALATDEQATLGGPLTAWCWGSDTHGQLGDGRVSGTPADSPVKVVTTGVEDGFVRIDVGRRHVCGIGGSGFAYCWGSDEDGQLGNGSASGNVSTPKRVAAGARRFFGISAGDASSCAVDVKGQAYCWGANGDGRLGVGDRVDRAAPTAVDQHGVSPSPIVQIVTGDDTPMLADVVVGGGHACGVDVQSGAYCWGANDDGQLGTRQAGGVDAPTRTRLTPDPPTGVQVRPGDKRLRVGWRFPVDTGVTPVTGYAAFALHGGGKGAFDDMEICASGTRHCVISGVTNGRRYSVFVATTTLTGVAFSEIVDGTPEGGPILPVTGAAVLRYPTVGVTLIVLGVLMLLAARRRRIALPF